jgi:hypothetical protein
LLKTAYFEENGIPANNHGIPGVFASEQSKTESEVTKWLRLCKKNFFSGSRRLYACENIPKNATVKVAATKIIRFLHSLDSLGTI